MSDIKVIANKEDIDVIANAVQNKIGTTRELAFNEIASGIDSIETGGVDASGLTAMPGYVAEGYTYIGSTGERETGIIKEYGGGQLQPAYDPSEENGKWYIPAGFHRGATYFRPETSSSEQISGTDVSDTTATANDVLRGKYFYNSSGTYTQGTIVNRGAWSDTINTNNTTIAIPEGYHNGDGQVIVNIGTTSSGTDVSGVTATAESVRSGKVFYGANGKETGTMIDVTVDTYEIDSTGGLWVTNVKSGYIEAGIREIGQLPIHAGGTAIPRDGQTTFRTKGHYMLGDVVVQGDSNLTSENIKYGTSIFGVEGAYGQEYENIDIIRIQALNTTSFVVPTKRSGVPRMIYIVNKSVPSSSNLPEGNYSVLLKAGGYIGNNVEIEDIIPDAGDVHEYMYKYDNVSGTTSGYHGEDKLQANFYENSITIRYSIESMSAWDFSNISYFCGLYEIYLIYD